MIKISNLNKYYNKGNQNQIHVINDVNLELPSTGLIAILGHSGSGKTTLLNVIGGLDKATGTINYDDTKIENYSMMKVDKYRREHIGYIFQNYNLLPDMSIYDNLKVVLDVIDITDPEEVKKRIDYALNAVGLGKCKKKLASSLSGGQQQRVSIARALVKNSKIIIADEPTGNLDSENSVEIMNILKKISKKSLVLLVTHNQQLAEFYAEEIIEIKDGKIINTRQTNHDASLDGLEQNTIYLKDMTQVEGKDEKVSYQLYLEDQNFEKIEFRIVQHNQQFYLESNCKIKLLENSPLVLVDDHYKEVKKADLDDFDYDTSWFNDTKKSNIFHRIGKYFVSAFKGFFLADKKKKRFRIIFLLLGIVLGFINVSYTFISTVDTSNFTYDNDVYTFYKEKMYNDTLGNKNRYKKIIEEAFRKDYIDKFYPYMIEQYNLSIELNTYQRISYGARYATYDINLIEENEYLAGRKVLDSTEVVIGKTAADQIVKVVNTNGFNYQHLIGLQMSMGSKPKKIVGVVNKESNALYGQIDYGQYSFSFNNNMNNEKMASYGFVDYEKDRYEVVVGNDIEVNEELAVLLNVDNVLLLNPSMTLEQLQNEFNLAPQYITIKDESFLLKGYFKAKENYKHLPKAIINNVNYLDNPDTSDCNYIGYDSSKIEYQIVEGKDATSKYECLVSAYSNLKVGEKYDDLLIVGKYLLNETYFPFTYGGIYNSILIETKTLSFLKTFEQMGDSADNYSCTFEINNKDKTRELFDRVGLDLVTFYDAQYLNGVENNQYTRNSILPMVIILVGATVIYIYFTMRSKMIQDIYKIGVNRALGFSRKRILLKYAIEIFVTTLFTSLISYLVVSFGYDWIFAIPVSSIGFYVQATITNLSTYIIFFGLLMLNIIVGLIPIILLMRKTPSEIIAKYDI